MTIRPRKGDRAFTGIEFAEFKGNVIRDFGNRFAATLQHFGRFVLGDPIKIIAHVDLRAHLFRAFQCRRSAPACNIVCGVIDFGVFRVRCTRFLDIAQLKERDRVGDGQRLGHIAGGQAKQERSQNRGQVAQSLPGQTPALIAGCGCRIFSRISGKLIDGRGCRDLFSQGLNLCQAPFRSGNDDLGDQNQGKRRVGQRG